MNEILNDQSETGATASASIQKLNDRFRKEGYGNGSMMITAGVKSLGDAFVYKAFHAVRKFNDFSEDNDPWGEHDFGMVVIDGEKLMWKIDYYNRDMTAGSEDPACEKKTRRILTIMLASEY